jgi:hypothetical protein
MPAARAVLQPRASLIASSPALKIRRLAEVELGGLLLLGEPRDGRGGAGLAIRADALSRGGDLSEGAVRLGGGAVRFEPCALDASVIALEVEYLLEPDLQRATVRSPEAGDLLAAAGSVTVAGILIAGAWREPYSLLDLETATVRPLASGAAARLSLGWQLVEARARGRILFRHVPAAARAWDEDDKEAPGAEQED